MTDLPDPPGGQGLRVAAPIPGSGLVVVASDALLSQLDSLRSLGETLQSCADVLSSVISESHSGSLAGPGTEPPELAEVRRLVRATLQLLGDAADRATGLGCGVRGTLARYENSERQIVAIGHLAAEGIAEVLGFEVRQFALPLATIAAVAIGGVLLSAAITGRSPADLAGDVQTFLKVHGRILTNPLTVMVIRELVSDADGFGAGFMLEPPLLATMKSARGITGVSSSANTVVDLGRRIGLFEPTGVTVHKTSSFEYGSPPASLVDRSNSFPRPLTDPNGEQIRIDRYVEPGKPDRFDVYIAGTATFDPKTGDEPFDLKSDLSGVGQKPTASCQAVLDAMHEAGVTQHSPVVLNGYSQGGLIASMIAASGQYDVKGVVTFGAPSAQVHVPPSIPVLTVRNSEDLVPATSGYDVNSHAVVVTRDAFAHRPVPSDVAVPAHELSVYQETAAVVDRSRSSEVRDVLNPLNSFGAGATRVDSTLWVARRVPDLASAATGGR